MNFSCEDSDSVSVTGLSDMLNEHGSEEKHSAIIIDKLTEDIKIDLQINLVR